jgi:hypothetical protein
MWRVSNLQGTDVCDKSRAHGEDGTGQALVHQRVHSTVLDHGPSRFCALDVALTVQRHVAEGIAVDELHGPLENADETAQNAESNLANNVAITSCLVAGHRAELSQELDDGDNERSKGDAAKAVGEGTASGTASGALGWVARVEVPCAEDSRDDDMCGILDPLGNPVGGESDEDEQANDSTLTTASHALVTGRVAPWFVFDIDRYQRDREPRAEGCCEQTTEERNEVDVAIGLGDVDRRLQHQNREWDSRDPGNEADDCEDAEDEEHYATTPVFPGKHVDGSDETGDDVENARDPDELFGELCFIVSIPILRVGV